MWFAVTPEWLAVAPDTYTPLARTSVGEATIRKQAAPLILAIGRGPVYIGQRLQSIATILTGAPFVLSIARADLRKVEAVEPWPSVRIVFRSGRVIDERIYSVDGRPSHQSSSFSKAVEALFGGLEEMGHECTLERGWLNYPVVRWQPVDAMPEGARDTGQGAYRSGSVGQAIVAHRPAAKGIETLLCWLSSTPERRFRDTPFEVTLTPEDVWVRFHGGRVGRVPRSALIEAHANSEGDTTYRFGRRLFLLMPHREGCEVVAALNRQLEASASKPGSPAKAGSSA